MIGESDGGAARAFDLHWHPSTSYKFVLESNSGVEAKGMKGGEKESGWRDA